MKTVKATFKADYNTITIDGETFEIKVDKPNARKVMADLIKRTIEGDKYDFDNIDNFLGSNGRNEISLGFLVVDEHDDTKGIVYKGLNKQIATPCELGY